MRQRSQSQLSQCAAALVTTPSRLRSLLLAVRLANDESALAKYELLSSIDLKTRRRERTIPEAGVRDSELAERRSRRAAWAVRVRAVLLHNQVGSVVPPPNAASDHLRQQMSTPMMQTQCGRSEINPQRNPNVPNASPR